jgi:hypothetical protein
MQSFYVGQYPAHVLGRDHRQYPCDKDKAQRTKQAHDHEVGRKALRKTEARVGKVGHHFLPNASALMGVALPSRPLCEPIHISADVSLTKKSCGISPWGAGPAGALCERDRACPHFTRMELHNHLSMVYQFNTADDALGRQILEFIRRGR